jgi:outer membrane protein assembly factor BamA
MIDTINDVLAENLVMVQQRVFENEIGAFSQYPLSKNLRFEGGVSASRYGFQVDSINNYFVGNLLVEREKYELEAPEAFYIYRTFIAYVGDNARFGLTSPMSGNRFRLQVDKTFGEFRFWGLQADYRQYRHFPPIALAFRILHYGRYGPDAGQLQPVFVGNPFFVRGYRFRAITRPETSTDQFISINNLLGSKIVVSNAELRFPFTGPEQLALIKSRIFLSDLVLFADGGLAWHNFDDIAIRWRPVRDDDTRIPVFSSGIALRVNLFGAVIVEPYFAFPFQRRADQTRGTLGFHLSFGGF